MLEGDATSAAIADSEENRTWDEWLQISARSSEAWICDHCACQYDVQPTGRWRRVTSKPGSQEEYYPDEWAKIAAGLKPDAGNATCDHCEAEFWQDDSSLTLLAFQSDPYKFASRYLDQRLELADISWLGAGKTSGSRGLLCTQCDTEFDDDGEFLKLTRSPSVRLSKFQGRSLAPVDWHKLAQGLPLTGEEQQLFARLDEALAEGYVHGTVAFDSPNPELIWSGQAKELDWEETDWVEIADGNLTITTKEIVFGKLLKKWRAPLSGVLKFSGEEDRLHLTVSGEEQERVFAMAPAEVEVDLASGKRTVIVGAELVAQFLLRKNNPAS